MTEQQPRDPSTPLRVAIIGYGLAGQVFHAPLASSTPGMEVSALVTRNPERRERARHDYPGAAILDAPERIWDKEGQFDLVVVATHNTSHASIATASLQHGIPVVVDKPMALSVDEAEALIETSGQTGVPLTVFQNRRWDGDFLTLRQLIADGALGPISRFESRFERYRPSVRSDAWRDTTTFEEGGGLLWDLGSHLIDQALQLFGEPTGVYAELPQRRRGATVDDDTFIALTFANGVNAHLWMSATSRILGPRFRLHGLRGSYEKYGLDPQEDMLKSGKTSGRRRLGAGTAQQLGLDAHGHGRTHG